MRPAAAAGHQYSEEVFALSKIRLRFSKTGMGKYISHLDLLRTFTRAIQRAGLPVMYSQGFNPHQKLTFSLPLPVGVTSECECVDVEFTEQPAPEFLCAALNKNLPMDIHILSASEPRYAANTIVSAEYRITLGLTAPILDEALRQFFGAPEIAVVKKSKKGERTVNLLSFVKAYEVQQNTENQLILRVVLDAGGERNLKPELLVNALEAVLQPQGFTTIDVHRQQIFCQQGDALQPFA